MGVPVVERLLAVDLGSRVVGWAYFNGGDLLSAGSWVLESRGKESEGVRWLRLRARLDEVLDVSRYRVDLIVYEDVKRHEGTGAAHAYGGARAHLLAWAAQRRIDYMPIQVSQIKQAAVGKGGGRGTDKESVLHAARLRWPRIKFSDGEFDTADACFIGVAALVELGIVKRTPAVSAPAKKTKKTEPGQTGLFSEGGRGT